MTRASIPEQVAAAKNGSIRAVARLLSAVEGGGERAAAVARELTGAPRNAEVIGITGAPGSGKSTLTNAILRRLRGATGSETEISAEIRAESHAARETAGKAGTALSRSVAVLAVDPSSPFSGGALLGDRVRMADHVLDPGVFIRSMSSRGHLGGLSAGTPAAVDLMSALGFDVVIIETVGVGQSEVDVMNLADTVAVVLAPGMGDAVQAAKAGILEIADLLVVNKADHEGARSTARELKGMVSLGGNARTDPARWAIPVLQTIAENGTGVPELLEAFDRHYEHLTSSGELATRRATRAAIAVNSVVMERLREAIASDQGRSELARAADRVISGEVDFHRAAGGVLDWLRTTAEM